METDVLNPLNAELNPICHLLALVVHHILHVSRVRVNPTSGTSALGWTQPLTEMSARDISWGLGRDPVRRADELATFMCRRF